MKSGTYKKNLTGDLEYKSFYPTPLKDLEFETFDKRTIELLTEANYLLGKLNGISSNIKDIDMFVDFCASIILTIITALSNLIR